MIYSKLQLLIYCFLLSESVAYSSNGDLSLENVVSEFKVLKQNQEKCFEKVDVLEKILEKLEERNDELEQEVKRLGDVEKRLLNMLKLDAANEEDESRSTKRLEEHGESNIERIPDEKLMRHRRQHTQLDVTSSGSYCSSPGYVDDLPYAVNTSRDYRFQTFYPNHTLLLTVVDFVLENADENHACLFDKVEIYDVQAGHRIAFTAGVGVTNLNNLGVHHTVIFDNVLTNIGHAYHPNTGIFIAPFKGAYVFTLTAMVNLRQSDYLEIVVDGVPINDILTDATGVDDYVSTAKQWILELQIGSELWNRTTTLYNQGIHGNMHTLLNGFLLFET